MHNLPLHYYVLFLVQALRGLKELHYDSLPSKEIETLIVNANGTCDIPSGCIKITGISIIDGDRLEPLTQSNKLNPSDETLEVSDPFDWDTDDNPYIGFRAFSDNHDKGLQWEDYVRVIQSKGIIRVDNRSGIEEVVITYITEPKQVSGKSVIHPFAVETLMNFVAWQYAIFNPTNRFDPEKKRRDFYNANRILRGRLNPLTAQQITRATKAGVN